jgi:hypothetical protein
VPGLGKCPSVVLTCSRRFPASCVLNPFCPAPSDEEPTCSSRCSATAPSSACPCPANLAALRGNIEFRQEAQQGLASREIFAATFFSTAAVLFPRRSARSVRDSSGQGPQATGRTVPFHALSSAKRY